MHCTEMEIKIKKKRKWEKKLQTLQINTTQSAFVRGAQFRFLFRLETITVCLRWSTNRSPSEMPVPTEIWNRRRKQRTDVCMYGRYSFGHVHVAVVCKRRRGRGGRSPLFP